jgi:hypothetical protein
VTDTAATRAPVILFGAFDRHNFGDLLFPHVTLAMLGKDEPVFAGLAVCDLCSHGGHRIQSITDLARKYRNTTLYESSMLAVKS